MTAFAQRPAVALRVARALARRLDLAEARLLRLDRAHPWAWEPSPLEEALWYALHELAHATGRTLISPDGETRGEPLTEFWSEIPGGPVAPRTCVVQREVAIGTYRADFVLTRGPGVHLALEADGATYHRTSKQLAHDAERDRAFARAGVHVLRLEGAAITADPIACAEQAFLTLEKLTTTNLRGPS